MASGRNLGKEHDLNVRARDDRKEQHYHGEVHKWSFEGTVYNSNIGRDLKMTFMRRS